IYPLHEVSHSESYGSVSTLLNTGNTGIFDLFPCSPVYKHLLHRWLRNLAYMVSTLSSFRAASSSSFTGYISICLRSVLFTPASSLGGSTISRQGSEGKKVLQEE